MRTDLTPTVTLPVDPHSIGEIPYDGKEVVVGHQSATKVTIYVVSEPAFDDDAHAPRPSVAVLTVPPGWSPVGIRLMEPR